MSLFANNPASRAKTSLDYLIENEKLYHTSEEYVHKRNPYISAFVRSGLAHRIVMLASTDVAIRKLINHRKLRKEVTESYGAMVLLEQCARRLEGRNYHNYTVPRSSADFEEDNQYKRHDDMCLDEESSDNSPLNFTSLHRAATSSTPLVFLDVCSGKGITSFLLALLFPTARVVMLDFNNKINRDHLLHPACSNISFQLIDVYTSAFEQYMSSVAHSFSISSPIVSPPQCFVLGTHLCGHLSTRLVDVFSSSSCDSLAVLILSPCCMPNKKDKIAKKEKEEWKEKKKQRRLEKRKERSGEQENNIHHTSQSTISPSLLVKRTAEEDAHTISHQQSFSLSSTASVPTCIISVHEQPDMPPNQKTVQHERVQQMIPLPSCNAQSMTTEESTSPSIHQVSVTKTVALNGAPKLPRDESSLIADPYMNWCREVLLLLPHLIVKRDLQRDKHVLSEKDAFIFAVRRSALRIGHEHPI